METFVLPQRRSRYVDLLATKRGRETVRRRLAHFSDLDPRFARRLADASIDAIGRILRLKVAPETCYVFSESAEIDTLEIELETALAKVVGQGIGAILSCVSGKLAYFEGEEPGERYLLRRPSFLGRISRDL